MKCYSIIKNSLTYIVTIQFKLLEKITIQGISIKNEKDNVVGNIYISSRGPLFYPNIIGSLIADQTSDQREAILKPDR